MADTITNFLVGIGFDYDDDGQKKMDGGIDSIKSKALQLGAVIGGAFGVKALTSDFANANDKLGKFSEVFGVTANDASAIGAALEKEGGSLESFLGQLAGIDKMRAGLLTGDAAFIAAVGKAGIDPKIITDAETASDAYLALSDSFAAMTKAQRLNAAAALGLDEASIRLLSQGRDGVDETVEAMKRMRPVTKEMTDESARFNDNIHDMGRNLGGFADGVSMSFLPAVNDAIGATNDWIDVNRDGINQGMADVIAGMTGEYKEFTAVAALLGAAAAAAYIAKMAVMVPAIGGLLARAAAMTGAGLAVGAAGVAGVAVGNAITNQIEGTEASDMIGEGIAQTLAFFGNDQAQESIDARELATSTAQKEAEQRRYNEQRADRESLNLPSENQKPVQVILQLDGKVLDDRIIETNERQNNQTLQELNSTVDA